MRAPRSRFRGSARLFYAAAIVACLMAVSAQAQQPPAESRAPLPADQPVQPAPQVNPPAAPLPAAPDQPRPKRDGFFDALGRWWDKSAADFKSSVDQSNAKWKELGEQTQKANKDAMTATKDATDALMKLSNTRIVEARERCDVAPNGSADCSAVAERVCKSKGFAIGKSADIQSNRKCSARSWLSGNPSEKDCKDETILIKAACNN